MSFATRKLSILPQNARRFASTSNNTTLIVGGGPIGLSTAYHLAISSPNTHITILERDPTYTRASATLSAGGLRQQFSLKENVQMSMYGRDFLRSSNSLLRVDDEEVDVQFQEKGYLFLASSEKGANIMRRNNEVQTGVGADIKLLNRDELVDKFPWLNTEDIILGSYGGELSKLAWITIAIVISVHDIQYQDLFDSFQRIKQTQEKGGLIHGYSFEV